MLSVHVLFAAVTGFPVSGTCTCPAPGGGAPSFAALLSTHGRRGLVIREREPPGAGRLPAARNKVRKSVESLRVVCDVVGCPTCEGHIAVPLSCVTCPCHGTPRLLSCSIGCVSHLPCESLGHHTAPSSPRLPQLFGRSRVKVESAAVSAHYCGAELADGLLSGTALTPKHIVVL